MRAVISSFNLSLNNWQARTDSDIALSFCILDGTRLRLNEELEVDLPNLLASQKLVRRSTGASIAVRLRDIDLHDLRLPSGHGSARTPSSARLNDA